jgi:hypothetical protein
MSYFMVTCGSAPDLADLAPVELIPTPDAQSYIHPIANAICAMSQAPAFLVHDGLTGTSDDFVADAENALKDNGTLEGSALFSIIHRLAAQGNAVLIWWANNAPLAYQAAETCSSVEVDGCCSSPNCWQSSYSGVPAVQHCTQARSAKVRSLADPSKNLGSKNEISDAKANPETI